jgi:hypothetical protein
MAQGTDLANHIMDLIRADTELVASLHSKWFYVGVPETFPSIYIDGLYLLDDKIDTWRFNVSLATTDMSLGALSLAQKLLAALQQSHCVSAQGILPRPEPDNKRNRFLVPCSAYMNNL